MLEFFRRYQKFFFLVITIVIVISFSFFGTFQAMQGRHVEDKVAFTAIDGSKIYTSELNDMVAFLSRDASDIYVSLNPFAANALNDGVIAEDILQTGLGQVIAKQYLEQIGDELQPKLEREKRYVSYRHPKAPFLSAEQVWAYYAPDIKTNITELQKSDDAKAQKAFRVRTALYLAQRNFPPAYLKQFLRYQESMHKWLSHDPALDHQDVSLFGYHNVQEWFGRRFIELSAECIINAAKMAEQKGYMVNSSEVLGSLYRNCESAYRAASSQNSITASSPQEYFQQQLRMLGMDQGRVVKIWKDVLLFREFFFSNADSVLVDPTPYQEFYKHINEYVTIDLYQLPEPLRFSKSSDLEKYILYKDAVTEKNNNLTYSPNAALREVSSVQREYPELVEKSFTLKWAEVNKERLQTKVGVKATWQWQVEEQNWQKLVAEYPELGQKEAITVDERLQLLDGLEPAKRQMVDSFARREIINEHPEWIEASFSEAEPHEEVLLLRHEKGPMPFTGISNQKALLELLQEAPLQENSEALSPYTQDGVHYYQIHVLDRDPDSSIVSFEDAQSDKTLDGLYDKKLKELFDKNPKEFTNDKEKRFEQVKNKVADRFFEKYKRVLLQESTRLQQLYPKSVNCMDESQLMIASYFLPYMIEERKNLVEDPENTDDFVSATKLVRSTNQIVRKGSTTKIDQEVAFSLEPRTTSEIFSNPECGLHFYQVIERGELPSDDMLRQKILSEREILGNALIMQLGSSLIEEMKRKESSEPLV